MANIKLNIKTLPDIPELAESNTERKIEALKFVNDLAGINIKPITDQLATISEIGTTFALGDIGTIGVLEKFTKSNVLAYPETLRRQELAFPKISESLKSIAADSNVLLASSLFQELRNESRFNNLFESLGRTHELYAPAILKKDFVRFGENSFLSNHRKEFATLIANAIGVLPSQGIKEIGSIFDQDQFTSSKKYMEDIELLSIEKLNYTKIEKYHFDSYFKEDRKTNVETRDNRRPSNDSNREAILQFENSLYLPTLGEDPGTSFVNHQRVENLIYFAESRLRIFVDSILSNVYGQEWYKNGNVANKKMTDGWLESKDKEMSVFKIERPVIEYSNFMDLLQLIIRNNNWPHFKHFFKNKKYLEVTMERLHPFRNYAGHNRDYPLDRYHILTLRSEVAHLLRAIKEIVDILH